MAGRLAGITLPIFVVGSGIPEMPWKVSEVSEQNDKITATKDTDIRRYAMIKGIMRAVAQ